MKTKHPRVWIFLLCSSLSSVRSESLTKVDRGGDRGFTRFVDDSPSVVVKTSRVTSSSSAVSTSSKRSLVGRGHAVPPRISSTTERAHFASILKQINEHNEDGSYTYGYEASDGSFKLETRYPDGRVQGKYGYVDINGEQKVIEYGADMLGFQPQGDLPEGIIVPPPVFNNDTDGQNSPRDYDYDYSGTSGEEEAAKFIVKNRARTPISRGHRGDSSQSLPTQNRGQNVRQPVEKPPRVRFTHRFQTNFEEQAARLAVPQPPIPTVPPPTTAALHGETFSVRNTPISVTPPSIEEIPQSPRKIRIHPSSRKSPSSSFSRSSVPRKIVNRARRPPPPSSGSPDPVEALKAFMLANGGRFESLGRRPASRRKLRNENRPSATPKSIPPPPLSSSSSGSRFSSFPARSGNKGLSSRRHQFSRESSPVTTTASPLLPSPSPQSRKLPASFQEQRRPIRILTSAVPGASLNRISESTEKPRPGEIVPTDVDFDALIQEFTGQRRRQGEGTSRKNVQSGGGAFPHFKSRSSSSSSSGPSSLDLFADFS